MNEHEITEYIRAQMQQHMLMHLFEINDDFTRGSIKYRIGAVLSEMVERKILSDFSVVSDESNNTPERIDRRELWVEVSAYPANTGAAMLYIPACLKAS